MFQTGSDLVIHQTAIIHPSASLATDVSVGPYSVIDENVQIDAGTKIGPHVVINGHTRIGKNNQFFQFCSVGEANQDKKYAGEPTRTVIGDNNVIRECCTIHRGTVQDREETSIGNNNLLMAYVHIAHDCILGDNVIIANSCNLAGHVHMGNHAILGGNCGVHQFVHIGEHAFVGIASMITQDILPYMLYAEGKVRSINAEGLKRRGFSQQQLTLVKKAYKTLFRQGLTIAEATEILSADNDQLIQQILSFISHSKRGLCR